MTTIQTNNPPTDMKLMTLEEARALLRISRWGLQRLIDSRQLPTIAIGRRRFVTPSDLDQLIADLRTGGPHGR
jgi:excisionase family DNA binding protein